MEFHVQEVILVYAVKPINQQYHFVSARQAVKKLSLLFVMLIPAPVAVCGEL